MTTSVLEFSTPETQHRLTEIRHDRVICEKGPMERASSTHTMNSSHFEPAPHNIMGQAGRKTNYSVRIRLHPDDPELVNKRKIFFSTDSEPHIFYLVYYVKLASEILGTQTPADLIFKQLADDLYCALPFETAKSWLRLLPQAQRDFQFLGEAQSTLSELENGEDFAAEKLSKVILTLAERAERLAANFDLEYVASELLSGMLTYTAHHGLEAALDCLERLESALMAVGLSYPGLALIKAKLLLNGKKFTQAQSIITQFLEDPHPSRREFAKYLDKQRQQLSQEQERYNASAGDFSAEIIHGDHTGESFKLSNYVGKIVVLSFWQSWCAGCVAEISALEEFYQQNRGYDLVILAISQSQHEKSQESILGLRKKYDVHYPQVFDTGEIAQMYGVDSLPYIVVIGRDGKIKKTLLGSQTRNFVTEIQELLGTQP